MAKILINDLFHELSAENERLLRELRLSEKYIELIAKYRQLLFAFKKTCICDQNITHEDQLNRLEELYQDIATSHRPHVYSQSTAGQEVLDINESIDVKPKTIAINIPPKTKILKKLLNEVKSKSSEVRPKKTKKKYVYYNHSCDWVGCDRRYSKRDDLLAHRRSVHTNEKPYQCSTCERRFTTERLLKSHRIYNQKFGLKCSESKAKDRDIDKSGLREHVCDYKDCNKAFKTLSNLNKHKTFVHTSDKPYRCCWPGCGAEYKYKPSLIYHQLSHSNSGQFECHFEGCDQSFDSLAKLRAHSRSHKTKKRYPCDWPGCQFSDKSKRNLMVHMNRHQNIKPFKCPNLECDTSYYTSYELDHHITRVHTVVDKTDRPFKCDVEGCGLSYATERDFKHHKRRHDRIYRCSWPECDQSYAAKILLTEHMDRHLNVKSHKCLYSGCNKEFFTLNNFKSHMKRMHNRV